MHSLLELLPEKCSLVCPNISLGVVGVTEGKLEGNSGKCWAVGMMLTNEEEACLRVQMAAGEHERQ